MTHRPNVDLRRVPPLDEFERAMVRMPARDPLPPLQPTDGISWQAWCWVAGCAVVYVLIYWWRA